MRSPVIELTYCAVINGLIECVQLGAKELGVTEETMLQLARRGIVQRVGKYDCWEFTKRVTDGYWAGADQLLEMFSEECC